MSAPNPKLVAAFDRVTVPDDAIETAGQISVSTIPHLRKIVFTLPRAMRRGGLSPDAARAFAAALIAGADAVSPRVFTGFGFGRRG